MKLKQQIQYHEILLYFWGPICAYLMGVSWHLVGQDVMPSVSFDHQMVHIYMGSWHLIEQDVVGHIINFETVHLVSTDLKRQTRYLEISLEFIYRINPCIFN